MSSARGRRFHYNFRAVGSTGRTGTHTTGLGTISWTGLESTLSSFDDEGISGTVNYNQSQYESESFANTATGSFSFSNSSFSLGSIAHREYDSTMTATGSVGTVTNWATDWTNYDEDNTLFHNNVTSWFSQTITSSSSSTFVGTPSPLVVDDLGDLEDLYSFTQPSIDNVGGPLFEAIASRATRGRGYAPHVVYQYGITAAEQATSFEIQANEPQATHTWKSQAEDPNKPLGYRRPEGTAVGGGLLPLVIGGTKLGTPKEAAAILQLPMYNKPGAEDGAIVNLPSTVSTQQPSVQLIASAGAGGLGGTPGVIQQAQSPGRTPVAATPHDTGGPANPEPVGSNPVADFFQALGSEIYFAAGTIQHMGGAIGQTFASGEAADSVLGWSAGLYNHTVAPALSWITGEDQTSGLKPWFGHDDAFGAGKNVGTLTGFVMDIAMMVGAGTGMPIAKGLPAAINVPIGGASLNIAGVGAVGVASTVAVPVAGIVRATLAGLGLYNFSVGANGSQVGGLSKTAEDISNGHAYDKHVVRQGEFPGIKSRSEFATEIDRVMKNPSHKKPLSGGRTAYWDDMTGTVVIHNPKAVDQGTAFKPSDGKTYFDNLK